jgi:hypothetical protein
VDAGVDGVEGAAAGPVLDCADAAHAAASTKAIAMAAVRERTDMRTLQFRQERWRRPAVRSWTTSAARMFPLE